MEEKYEVVKFVNNEIELYINIDSGQETIWINVNQITRLFEKDEKN